MSVSIQDPRATPRHIAEQLKRFVLLAEVPQSTAPNGTSLSDAGFVLLSLKDQILVDNSRSQHFCQEFISRPLNGVELLSKVVMVLQGIVNSNQPPPSKISNLLSRNNSNTNRKRKAAVAEADCIECLKILLEKSENAWRRFLDSTSGLDAVLYSVNSPQLDSKCYALEILLLLLDQPQGFVILMRALTALAARNRDYLRFTMFVAQLKHGLHTNKLHIQILIVRLFNKLLATAPSSTHRSLIRSEVALTKFSVEYVENLLSTQSVPLGGMEVLAEELALWRSLGTPPLPSYGVEHNHIYGLTETEADTLQSDRVRHGRPPTGKYPTGSTVLKNVERQRFKKQSGMGSSGRSSAPGYYPESDRHSSNAFYPDRRSLTLSNRTWQAQSDASYSPPSLTRTSYTTDRRTPGGMRRAKSESAMLAPERGESPEGIPRGLKRFTPQEQQLYHPIQHTRAMSRSVHDLSSRDDAASSTLTRPNSARPPSTARPQSRTMTRTRVSTPTGHSPTRFASRLQIEESPPRARYASPSSPRARFAEPPIVEAQVPHAGFSYLFPSQPVVSSVVPKRAITPDPHSRSIIRSQSPASRLMSPSPRPDYDTRSYTENGQVVYIPINMDNGRHDKLSRYDRSDAGVYSTESRTSSRAKVRSPSINGVIGDDVRDALSQFDYLNDYDNTSIRGREREASYHF
ncbi:hypothetical protein Y032_0002g545 [Ancylostoma ceylanicum]|uniref:GBD/FH3 domain-containing protein n=1 Tax=Ancylostoma ceylanicum TaxID=53326 RepID=A0A016VZI4_9BILA|nr:hypothetical protein Y032_0002g545 [Ancylostoma ceylanicum]